MVLNSRWNNKIEKCAQSMSFEQGIFS
jgi:hypothetical protein